MPDLGHLQLVPGVEVVGHEVWIKTGGVLTGYPNYSGLPGYTLFRVRGRETDTQRTIDRLLEQCQRDLAISYEGGA